MRQTVRANKVECTGCGACVSVCPKGAITMQPDDEGFLYPVVDGGKCVECDLCEKKCPAGRETPAHKAHTFGAQHKDAQLRGASSSGGVFTALARAWQQRGGVVFGAAFDEALRVEHVGAFDETELAAMRGSKYVQSDASEAIGHAASLLERGIPVLFSGTPCQISGLKAKVGGKYDDILLTIDFVCHGVPAPGVFASYLEKLEQAHGQKVVAYTFRDKRKGWKDFCAVATFEDGSESVGDQRTEPFLYGFLQNLYLRPACLQCTNLREGHHLADITMADLWCAEDVCPQQDDDSGLSFLFVNTKRGERALDACKQQLHIFPQPLTDGMRKYNSGIVSAPKSYPKRAAFYKHFKREGFDGELVMKLLAGPTRLERIAARIAHLPKGLARRVRVLLSKAK